MRDLDPVLLEKASELNIVIKGTWGNARIKQAIDAVETMNNAEGESKEAAAIDVVEAFSAKAEGADSKVGMTADEMFKDTGEALAAALNGAIDKFQTVEWASDVLTKVDDVVIPETSEQITHIKTNPEAITNMVDAQKFTTPEWASERASKIYAGQSPNLAMVERIGRIRVALKERGYTRWNDLVIDGAVDYQRYL